MISRRMFCIPLKEAKVSCVFPSVFERFERKPDRPFFWKWSVEIVFEYELPPKLKITTLNLYF